MTTSADSLRILILNRDLPVFPGWGGIEFLHTTRLLRHARQVGLVSAVNTVEQLRKSRQLDDLGIALFLWRSPGLGTHKADEATPVSDEKGIGKILYKTIRRIFLKPEDTFIPNLQFSHLAPSIVESFDGRSWDVLIVVQSSSGHWLDFIPPVPTSVLMLHDARALLYRRKAKSETNFFSRMSSLVEAFVYFCFERRVVGKYDLVITVSAADEEWVRKHYRPKRICTIPIPVDADYFCPIPSPRTDRKVIMFTGMMNHPPNSDAACFFAQSVFPTIRAVIPDAEFWVVGRDPTDKVKALASVTGVTVTGFVDDIRQYIAMAHVIVVPLRFGSGMRQKILEAWSMQKCVVSTTIGAEGLNFQDGTNILIADDAKRLASETVKALLEPSFSKEIRKNGREVVLKEHHPDILGKKYYDEIRSVVHEKRTTTRPMRILIDLRWMIPGLAGGIEDLSRSFVSCLKQLDHFNRYRLVVPARQKYDLDVRGNKNFSVFPHEGLSHLLSLFSRKVSRLVHGALRVPSWHSDNVNFLFDTRRWRAEIALSIPGYFNPDLKLLSNVLIVPDIQHDYYPEFFSPQELGLRKKLYGESICAADHLCAISEFTRLSLIERYNIPPEKVTTVHLAADPMFHAENRRRIDAATVLAKYGLTPGDFLLFPGNTWPHKNHRTLFLALGHLRDKYGLKPILVCTGAPKEAHSDLEDQMQRLGIGKQIRFLGYCPKSEMPALYQNAAGLVFPSLFEGFGLPVVEAMWSRCPIACSNITSLPEIAGDAALFFNPHSFEEMAGCVHRLLTDTQLRKELIARGSLRAPFFSWTRFTGEMIRILRQVWEERGF